jgi:hypothetical protein
MVLIVWSETEEKLTQMNKPASKKRPTYVSTDEYITRRALVAIRPAADLRWAKRRNLPNPRTSKDIEFRKMTLRLEACGCTCT